MIVRKETRQTDPMKPWLLREVSIELSLGRGDFDGSVLNIEVPEAVRPVGAPTPELAEALDTYSQVVGDMPLSLPHVTADLYDMAPKKLRRFVASEVAAYPLDGDCRPEHGAVGASSFYTTGGEVVLLDTGFTVLAPAGYGLATANVASGLLSTAPDDGTVDLLHIAAVSQVVRTARGTTLAHARAVARSLDTVLKRATGSGFAYLPRV